MKNFVLKTITVVMVIIFIVAGSSIDALSWQPTIWCAISLAWIVVFCIANNFFRDYRGERDA